MISVVITNFNGKELLEKNLPFVIAAAKNKKNNIKEIIIADDASTDDSVKFLKENFSDDVRIVVQKTNRGFASTTNLGVRAAKGELVCLLNNDVIPNADFLAEIEKNFEDKKVFAVSLHEKGYGYAKGKFKDGFIVHEPASEDSGETRETFWASGGSSVLRRDLFLELKGMDEVLLPFYWEDIDLSYRAQKRGYKILWDPLANVIHNHESTYSKLDQKYVSRIRERNQLLFVWKDLTSTNLIRKHRIALIKKILRHPGYLRIVLMARKKYGKVGELHKRELRETKVSDEAIFEKFN
jgi:GT2 family glycosyltransferase